MIRQETVALVDEQGILAGFAPDGAVPPGGVAAVELTLLYDPTTRVLILVSRGKGASDMRGRWALQSGKVQQGDLAESDGIGRVLSLDAFRNAAIRELAEEVGMSVGKPELEYVDRFFMQLDAKRLFFTLLGLPVEQGKLPALIPSHPEIERFGFFTIKEFRSAHDLGDAIMYRREAIVAYLNRVIG